MLGRSVYTLFRGRQRCLRRQRFLSSSCQSIMLQSPRVSNFGNWFYVFRVTLLNTTQLALSKLSEVKDLIPSAKELKETGIDFSLVNSWLCCVKQRDKKGLDLRTAAWEQAKELENWTEYCNLQKINNKNSNLIYWVQSMKLTNRPQQLSLI